MAFLSCGHVLVFGGTPVKIVCDNLKAGMASHPKRGGIILNEIYLSLGGYYSAAIMPTGVKKPKQKARVEGSVGKIATAVITKLRNDSFTSLVGLNAGIRKAVKEFNDRPFQKRPGSCRSIFETEEKPYLRALPLIPRIIHNAYVIPTNETNLRKLYDSKKLKKLVDEIES